MAGDVEGVLMGPVAGNGTGCQHGNWTCLLVIRASAAAGPTDPLRRLLELADNPMTLPSLPLSVCGVGIDQSIRTFTCLFPFLCCGVGNVDSVRTFACVFPFSIDQDVGQQVGPCCSLLVSLAAHLLPRGVFVC